MLVLLLKKNKRSRGLAFKKKGNESMSKIIGICVTLLTVLATSVYARDKPYQPYAMEFQWQKAIAKKKS